MNIGIALSSGSAKGWAHIGVLKSLLALGIRPTVVAGCSSGALVGAAYANNRLLQLEAWAEGMSHLSLMSYLDLNLGRGSLLAGDKLFRELEPYFASLCIEDLPMPFATVATDLYRGEEVWFRKGDLLNAVRASCAIPGILSPVKHAQRWLVDGAIVNPLPVSLCRAMGADFVIGVDVQSCCFKQVSVPIEIESLRKTACEQTQDNKQLGMLTDLLERGKEHFLSLTSRLKNQQDLDMGMVGVMNQSLEILEYRHKRTRLMGDPPELCITPEVSHIQAMEFHKAKEAIEAGRAAVQDVLHLLKKELKKEMQKDEHLI